MSSEIEYLEEIGLLKDMSVQNVLANIVSSYEGSSNAMHDTDYLWLEDNGMLESFDVEIVECETCGWWVETCEVDEAGICEDCNA